MTPRRVAPAAAGAAVFAAGCWVGIRVHRRALVRLSWRLVLAEANQNHALCRVGEDKLAKYGAHMEARNADLQARLDAYEQAGRVVDEAERITRGDL